ncbi:MAG: hypothetical protein K2W95_32485 [Candidatus Obscuribacterales bacterium]|nr:hypothetical protein [Candidatus Obscuribacterales bacterium]
MQKNAVISVKEAAALLELDERSIRERLINGSLRGEKRSHGQREKWYVYAGAIETELKQKRSHQGVAEMLNSISGEPPEPLNFSPASPGHTAGSISGNSTSEIVDAEVADDSTDLRSWLGKERDAVRELVQEMITPIAQQLQQKDRELQEATYRLGYLQGVMKDQEEQIKLLPDFQAKAEEAESLRIELSAERTEAEQAKERAAVLEQELESVKAAKEVEAKAVQEQLKTLTSKLQDLEKPWWKKVFG